MSGPRHRPAPARGGRGRSAARRRAKCPMCGAPTVAEHRPFCSRRCADADLARWLSGGYRIPVEDETDAEPEPEADGEGDPDRADP